MKFDFITDEEFRSSLSSDYRELALCMEAGAWKAVHVLAGSIIETILIDTLLVGDYKKRTGNDPLKMDLYKAIEASKSEKIISSKEADLSNVIKSYRNLIHPGRKLRLKEEVDKNSASIANSLVNMIVTKVRKRKEETYGYTAEQIVVKITSDSSVLSIIGHLLRTTNTLEIKKLLLKVIPEEYIKTINDPTSDKNTPGRLERSFRIAFDNASINLQQEVTKKFVSVLKEESDEILLPYETAFFRAYDLRHLDKDDIQLVKDHLLSRMDNPTLELLNAVKGLILYIEIEDAGRFTDLLTRIIPNYKDENLIRSAIECLIIDRSKIADDVRKKIVIRLDVWIPHLRKHQRTEEAQKVEEIKKSLDLPIKEHIL